MRIEDGRVLQISYGSANMYASADEFRGLLAFIEPRSHVQPQHPLGAEFPNGHGFIEAVQWLIQELPAKLRLPAAALPGTVASRDHIEKAAQQISGQTCLDDPTILAPIVAYVGEAIRGIVGGGWEIRDWRGPQADDNWQPVIVGANGREYPTFMIFKELLEGGSVRAVVSVEIGHRRI